MIWRLDGDIQRGGRLRRRSAGADCMRSPWRSSPAGSYRRIADGKRRQRDAGLGMPTCSSSSMVARAAAALLPPFMHVQRLHDLESMVKQGLRLVRRLLKDHRDVFAGDARRSARHGQQVLAVEDQADRPSPCRARGSSHRASMVTLLPEPDFADHAHRLSLVDGKDPAGRRRARGRARLEPTERFLISTRAISVFTSGSSHRAARRP